MKTISSDFYSIVVTGDETVDVVLSPPDGRLHIVRGVAASDDLLDMLEEDIRRRYDDWLASAEKI